MFNILSNCFTLVRIIFQRVAMIYIFVSFLWLLGLTNYCIVFECVLSGALSSSYSFSS